MSEQCDSCGKFCSRRSRLGEHPEYGLQVNYFQRCRRGGEAYDASMETDKNVTHVIASLLRQHDVEHPEMTAQAVEWVLGEAGYSIVKRSAGDNPVDKLVRAVRAKGSHPAFHDRKLRELAGDWPELHSAVMGVVVDREGRVV